MKKEPVSEKIKAGKGEELSIERKAELNSISHGIVSQIGHKAKLSTLLKNIGNEIVKVASPAVISVSVTYNDKSYHSTKFKYSSMVLRSYLETSGQTDGVIELYFNADFSENFEEYLVIKELLPFWRTIIAGALADIRLKELAHHHVERKKELTKPTRF
jgi:hypothetical protein